MKRLPLGIQNFKEIVNGGYVYVDKTQYVYDLISDDKYYSLKARFLQHYLVLRRHC